MSLKFSAPSSFVTTKKRSPCVGGVVVLDVVLDAVATRRHHLRRTPGIVGVDEPRLAGDLRPEGDDDVTAGARAPDRGVEALVVLLVHELVLVGGRPEPVAPDLPRAHGVVGSHVEARAVVVRPGQAVVHVGDDVGQVVAGREVAEAELVALAPCDVDGVRETRVVGADREAAEREVVVPGGELVLVEQHLLAGRRARRGERIGQTRCPRGAPALDPVLPALDRATEVLVRSLADRRARVGLLDAALDLLEQLLLQGFGAGHHLARVRVLGLQVLPHLRVVAVAEPEPVVDPLVAVRAQHDRAARGDGGSVAHDGGRSRRRAAVSTPKAGT